MWCPVGLLAPSQLPEVDELAGPASLLGAAARSASKVRRKPRLAAPRATGWHLARR